jgi:hypothetical protein
MQKLAAGGVVWHGEHRRWMLWVGPDPTRSLMEQRTHCLFFKDRDDADAAAAISRLLHGP